MKRLSLLSFVGLFAGVLAGCPIFPSVDPGTCVGAGCWNQYPSCTQSWDCQANETCGYDSQCHSGDCLAWGCNAGFTCTVSETSRIASCTADGTGGAGGMAGTGGAGGTTATGQGGTGGASSTTSRTTKPIYCARPVDCAAGQTCAADGTCKAGDCNANQGCIFGYTCESTGVCAPVLVGGCDKNTDCTAATGSVCVAGKTDASGKRTGGTCTLPADQCFDQSQCDAGDKCVAGKCTLACTANSDCRDGFACDTTLGVCSKPVKTCAVTNDCGSATSVCVNGACVPRSTNGVCPTAGDVWTENGCIPNQAPTFTCGADGVGAPCAASSVCLHHSCWISCDANPSACETQPELNTCKTVTSLSKPYNVCGSKNTLGGECDPTTSLACTGAKICIDGFCK